MKKDFLEKDELYSLKSLIYYIILEIELQAIIKLNDNEYDEKWYEINDYYFLKYIMKFISKKL
jgi:hypothetical protein